MLPSVCLPICNGYSPHARNVRLLPLKRFTPLTSHHTSGDVNNNKNLIIMNKFILMLINKRKKSSGSGLQDPYCTRAKVDRTTDLYRTRFLLLFPLERFTPPSTRAAHLLTRYLHRCVVNCKSGCSSPGGMSSEENVFTFSFPFANT